MGYSPGEKSGPGDLVDFHGSLSLSSRTVHANKGKNQVVVGGGLHVIKYSLIHDKTQTLKGSIQEGKAGACDSGKI